MNSSIPIFPLNLVVFPNSRYPLHIFEERYKKLINRCVSNKEGFGIIALIDDKLSKIGSFVVVEKITKIYDDGKMDIVVKCVKRFRLLQTSEHEDGYLEADVLRYEDDNLITETKSLNLVIDRFQKILNLTNSDPGEPYWRNLEKIDLSVKSFKIAEKSGLTLEQQQALLIERNEKNRLNFLLNHFEKVEGYINDSASVKGIILGDGYLNEL